MWVNISQIFHNCYTRLLEAWETGKFNSLSFKCSKLRLITKLTKQEDAVKSNDNRDRPRDCQFTKWVVNYKISHYQTYSPHVLWHAVWKQLLFNVCPVGVILEITGKKKASVLLRILNIIYFKESLWRKQSCVILMWMLKEEQWCWRVTERGKEANLRMLKKDLGFVFSANDSTLKRCYMLPYDCLDLALLPPPSSEHRWPGRES